MHFLERFADKDPHSALYYEAEPFSFVPPSIPGYTLYCSRAIELYPCILLPS